MGSQSEHKELALDSQPVRSRLNVGPDSHFNARRIQQSFVHIRDLEPENVGCEEGRFHVNIVRVKGTSSRRQLQDVRWREMYIRQIRQVAEAVESCFDCDLFDFDKLYDLLGCPGVENALRPRNQQRGTWDHIDVETASRGPLNLAIVSLIVE